MSTGTITFSIDAANEYVGAVNRKLYTDGFHLNLGMMAMWRQLYGAGLGKPWTGPEVMAIPMAVRKHSVSTGLANGAQTINLSTQSTDELIQFYQGQVIRPITVNAQELQACGTQDAVNRFVADRTSMVELDVEREFNRHIVAGGVSAYENSGRAAWNCFNGIDRSYGFFERLAFGSQTNVIGGFSKATWASVPQTQNIMVDVANSFSTNGLAQVFAGLTKLQKYTLFPAQKGIAGLVTEAFMNNYKRALAPSERYVSEKDLDGGWRPSVFGGVQLYIEEYLPVSAAYGGSSSNTYKMSALFVNANQVFPVWSPAMKVDDMMLPEGKMGLGTFRRLPEQYAWASEIRVAGALTIRSFADALVVIRGETW